MKATKKHKSHRLPRTKAVLLLILFSLIMGIVIGVVSSNCLSEQSYKKTADNTSLYLKSFKTNNQNKLDIFRESVVKYVKVVIIIWLLAFVPAGGFFTLIIIMVRGVSYGFTTSFLIKMFGSEGVVCAALLYLPQTLILIPTYFYIAFLSINFILFNLNSFKKSSSKKMLNDITIKYIVSFVICCLLCAFAAFIDAFVVPGLIKNI